MPEPLAESLPDNSPAAIIPAEAATWRVLKAVSTNAESELDVHSCLIANCQLTSGRTHGRIKNNAQYATRFPTDVFLPMAFRHSATGCRIHKLVGTLGE